MVELGCPDIFYKRALQAFCYRLNHENTEIKNNFLNEKSEEKLELEINKWRKKLSVERFFYEAGIVSENILTEADEIECDSFNAACGGLYDFERFIFGDKHEDEDD